MFIFSALILGFTSVTAQVLLTRELLVSFYGNEFFVGWIIFAWLFWVGMGSLLIKGFRNIPDGLPSLIACHLLGALLLPLTIFLIRLSTRFSATAGQIPDLLPAVLVSLFSVGPLGLVLGLQFILISRCWTEKTERSGGRPLLEKAYMFETTGFVVGGLVFSYDVIFWNEFHAAALICGLNAMAILAFVWSAKPENKRSFFVIASGLALCGAIFFLQADYLNRQTVAWRFPNQQLIETRNTIYGNLVVTRAADQFNFYESGLLTGADKEEAANEYIVHFPMLSHPHPREILFIGNGFNGALREILKYQPAEVYYAELDPALVDLACRYLPALRPVVNDRRIHVIRTDIRQALRTLPSDLDVIIMNLPNPSTALINRYDTDEFFKALRRHLEPDGIVSTHLAFSPDVVSAPLENLGASIYQTLKANFPSVVMLPDENLLMIASAGGLTQDPHVLMRRLNERNIPVYFMTDASISYRYTNDRVGKVRAILAANKTAGNNSDGHPRGYLYNLIYWLGIFHQGLAGAMTAVLRLNYFLMLGLAILPAAFLFLFNAPAVRKYAPVLAMAVGGFSLMSSEILVIYAFQCFYGNLYYKIAWIISAFMAGLAAGTFAGQKAGRGGLEKLAGLHAFFGICFLTWLGLLKSVDPGAQAPSEMWWIAFSLLIGGLTGLEFFCANGLFLAGQDGRRSTGTVYAADLFGSCAGALLTGIFFVPAYGVERTLVVLIIVNAVSAVSLFRLKT